MFGGWKKNEYSIYSVVDKYALIVKLNESDKDIDDTLFFDCSKQTNSCFTLSLIV